MLHSVMGDLRNIHLQLVPFDCDRSSTAGGTLMEPGTFMVLGSRIVPFYWNPFGT